MTEASEPTFCSFTFELLIIERFEAVSILHKNAPNLGRGRQH